MECRVAVSEADQMAILHQRYDVFVEEFPFFSAREDGKHIENDQYDDNALLFGVWDKECLIASCRLIFSNTLSGLPTYRAMVIDPTLFHDDQPTAEISRITIVSGSRILKQTFKILQTMQKEIVRVSETYGIRRWIGAVEPQFLHLLNRTHLPYRPIGPLQILIGAERYPVVLELQDYLISQKEYH